MKIILSILLLTLSLTTQANEPKIFINDIKDAQVALQASKMAFIKRRWKVVAEDENSVQGELNHKSKQALVTISYKDNALYYTCECFKSYFGRAKTELGTYKRQKITKPDEPVKWINNLRASTEVAIAEVSFTASVNNSKSNTKSIPERMKTLDQLLSQELISQDEYDSKRTQLLNEI